ncbi:MAG: hypothetical protein IJD92_01710 [Bacilli bacterium]|nr:hypothetical protein [Bacilli bacterium]
MKYKGKKITLYKLLGAEHFQKIVFKVEKLKYYILDKLFPNIEKWYFKECDRKRDNKLKRCKSDKEKQNIIEFYRFEKLKFKKELNKKENRNYHIDFNNPFEFRTYLELNKKIHIKGLIGNTLLSIILITISIILSNPYPVLLYSVLGYELICALINFECINLQNYNLSRLEEERMQLFLNKMSEKKKETFNKNMSQGSKVIGNAFRKSVDIPKIDDIINSITNKEEAKELLNYARKHLNSLKKETKKLERKKTL